jgi:mannose-6-phosphate isomerase-like protein (cupin superfamily)
MKGYLGNIEEDSLSNEFFRKVLYTGEHAQLVVMSLKPGEEIGSEVHDTVDQFIRVEKGEAKAVLDGEEGEMKDGFAVIVPAGTEHNIINTSQENELKLYTIYSPPNHPDGTIHQTKADAVAAEKAKE